MRLPNTRRYDNLDAVSEQAANYVRSDLQGLPDVRKRFSAVDADGSRYCPFANLILSCWPSVTGCFGTSRERFFDLREDEGGSKSGEDCSESERHHVPEPHQRARDQRADSRSKGERHRQH